MVSYREGTLQGAQETDLFWRIWAAEQPRCCLLLVHGLGEHSGRYDAFSRHMVGAGITVFSFDLRGHGRSEGPRGDVDTFPRFLEDLLDAESRMQKEVAAKVPSFLLGHSLGGLISIRRLQLFPAPYAGAILSAPWLATNLPEWVLRMGQVVSLVCPGISVPSGIGPGRLTRDPEIMRSWREDGLIHGKLTGRLFREARRVQKEVLDSPGALRLPLLFLIPGADQVVKGSVTETFAMGIAGTDVAVEVLPDRLHEPLNDLGREKVYAMVSRWLGAHLHSPSEPSQGSLSSR